MHKMFCIQNTIILLLFESPTRCNYTLWIIHARACNEIRFVKRQYCRFGWYNEDPQVRGINNAVPIKNSLCLNYD
ncbi:hypothetical protein GLYMA_10G222000v4 [Glycine max]|nr:hypothetical protein GLYMA_10G222000v4 [Glycine max]KAH1139566.1 hypothetical protein GYH30_028782 [Glycine max]